MEDDLNSAIDRMQDFVSRYANFAVAYNHLGVLFYQNGDKESALKDYQKAGSLDSRNIDLTKKFSRFSIRGRRHGRRGVQYICRRFEHRSEGCGDTIDYRPQYVGREKFEDAASFYEKVFEIEPTNSDDLSPPGDSKGKIIRPDPIVR